MLFANAMRVDLAICRIDSHCLVLAFLQDMARTVAGWNQAVLRCEHQPGAGERTAREACNRTGNREHHR